MRIDNECVRRAAKAWEMAAEGRTIERSESDGLHTVTLLGQGEPMVGTSRLSEDDAAAQALGVADGRAYVERYGTDEWQELSRLLLDLEQFKRAG